jgi:transposase
MVGAAKAAALKKGRVVKNGGRPVTEMNLVLDALFYRLRNCSPWRDMPRSMALGRRFMGGIAPSLEANFG